MTHALVLTSAQPLSDDLIARAEDLSAAAARRLGPCGADIALDHADAQTALPMLRDALAGIADVNLVAQAGREKRLLIADMDSTIIGVECIDEIADVAGVGAQVAAITEQAMRGELDFEGALKARVALLKDLPEAALEEVWRDRVRLNAGAETLVKTMNARGAMTALVSGGFTYFADRVAAAAGFRFARANSLPCREGRLTGEAGHPILGREAKLESLNALCAERDLTPDQAVAVGDGANDLAMVEAAGLGVAYRAKPTLAAKADARLDVSDLTAILFLQGIPAADFAA